MVARISQWLTVDQVNLRFGGELRAKTRHASKMKWSKSSECGPPKELVLENGVAFRSGVMRDSLASGTSNQCSYQPAGNDVVERNHLTIKRIARSNADPLDIIYWHNRTTKEGIDANSIPPRQIYS